MMRRKGDREGENQSVYRAEELINTVDVLLNFRKWKFKFVHYSFTSSHGGVNPGSHVR